MFVQTKSSILKKKTGESCDTIIFKSETSNRQICASDKNMNATKEKNKKEYNKEDLKELRYEIIKFGTAGFHGSKREESMIALAVALGAKPPKKKAKNYVEILAIKKEQKSKAVEQNPGKPISLKRTAKPKRNNGKRSGGPLKSYGKLRLDV